MIEYKCLTRGVFEDRDSFLKKLNDEAVMGWQLHTILNENGYIVAYLERKKSY